MKVVDLEGLGACPAGTIFSDYEPCIVSELYRLGEVIRRERPTDQYYRHGQVVDFLYVSLLASCRDCHAHHDPVTDWSTGLVVGDGESRWGLFKQDALFAVYEPEDVRRLVELLTSTRLEGE